MKNEPMESETVRTLSCIKGRKSIRAFLDKPVPRELLVELMETARWAPSSTNMQPWRVLLLTGEKKRELDRMLLDLFDRNSETDIELKTYLDPWWEPYRSRRRECGLGLYRALHIGKDDKHKMRASMRENFRAFGAPAVLFLYMDADLKEGSILDCGMFLQNVMLAARALGLETCPQASTVQYARHLKQFLGLSPKHRVIVGLAIGYGDFDHPANSLRTTRVEPDEFVTFLE